MKIRGIIFDLNGTLIDILTDEGAEEIYRVLANFLCQRGIELEPEKIRELYYKIMKEQRRASVEEYPEFDVVEVFRKLIAAHGDDFTLSLPTATLLELPFTLAHIYRAVSRFRLELYAGVRETLDDLRTRYQLAAITDAQRVWAEPELRAVGLDDYFSPMVISSDLGYRKPDARIFQRVIAGMDLEPDEILFVGNDMYRDIFGAGRLGLKTVFFRSNQGEQYRRGVKPDYIIYDFPELLEAISFFEKQK